jgi:hypothetical protein
MTAPAASSTGIALCVLVAIGLTVFSVRRKVWRQGPYLSGALGLGYAGVLLTIVGSLWSLKF